ncbi:MAG: cobalamin-binding protein [Planctomycetes bacterium]|nr:cobalamin-binding protein [Planctomycetota bacterium]
MPRRVARADCFGLLRPALDAHTLGIASVAQILQDCGCRAVAADAAACEAAGRPDDPAAFSAVERWLRENRITILGFSYRLDPDDGAALFARLATRLKARRLLAEQGGPLKALYFAGLPRACDLARQRVPEATGTFCGDETPAETLRILGVAASRVPSALAQGIAYDEDRLAFGRDLVRRADYLGVKPVDRSGYPGYGTEADTLAARVNHGLANRLPPLVRAHVGPYLPDRAEAVRVFLDWTRQLAAVGLLDVLSIGTSQLTQSAFGEDWGGRPNGGGVPLNCPEEFAAVWRAARPMLVRTYAGTRDVPALARMYEETIHIAWHALSLWWFCQVDGRGPYTVRENLVQHIETLRYIASTGKPYEPNVSHHFAFRGADDVTYIVAAVLAAGAAKACGVRTLILQAMLNTPKSTWGVADLAKARAMLALVRELEDDRFRVLLQPRGGLDYFSHDLEKAKAQLAAVTALMDDIERHDAGSPPVIHVVSYSEASHLADPAVVNESIQITRHALAEWRRLRAKGEVDDMAAHPDVAARTAELLAESRTILHAIEDMVPGWHRPAEKTPAVFCAQHPQGRSGKRQRVSFPREPLAEGLYQAFARGFLPVPYLWQCREEFAQAIAWPTRLVHGSVKVVDTDGKPMPAGERMRRVAGQKP